MGFYTHIFIFKCWIGANIDHSWIKHAFIVAKACIDAAERYDKFSGQL